MSSLHTNVLTLQLKSLVWSSKSSTHENIHNFAANADVKLRIQMINRRKRRNLMVMHELKGVPVYPVPVELGLPVYL